MTIVSTVPQICVLAKFVSFNVSGRCFLVIIVSAVSLVSLVSFAVSLRCSIIVSVVLSVLLVSLASLTVSKMVTQESALSLVSSMKCFGDSKASHNTNDTRGTAGTTITKATHRYRCRHQLHQ